MFRRREESDLLSNTETTENPGAAAYAPASAAPQAARPASSMNEAPKAAAPAAASSYRPAQAPSAPSAAPTISRFQEPMRGPASQNNSANNASGNAGKQSGNKRVLTVGHDILLKGEIATCDRLVIEGSVDATLKDVHTLELAETGSFKGTAEVEDAEISGLFEGDLIIRNRLVIYSTGQVRGNVTYGEIEIERGGELTGTIKTMNSASTEKSGKKAAA